MSAPQKGSGRVSHILTGIVALGLIALHFPTYGEMYQEIFTEDLSLSAFGTGKVLIANIVVFSSIFGALLCLCAAFYRSVVTAADRSVRLSVFLLLIGFFWPIFGIIVGWFIGGDAL